MSKSEDKKKEFQHTYDELHPAIYVNENKTLIAFTIGSDVPICEKTFVAMLYDFVAVYGEDFSFDEIAGIIEYEKEEIDTENLQ